MIGDLIIFQTISRCCYKLAEIVAMTTTKTLILAEANAEHVNCCEDPSSFFMHSPSCFFGTAKDLSCGSPGPLQSALLWTVVFILWFSLHLSSDIYFND